MEMQKLIEMLADAGIPFQVTSCWGTPQVCYPSDAERVCDAVCHSNSYGYSEDLLEIMGLVDSAADDDVEGWLTAEEVFSRIQKDYEKRRVTTTIVCLKNPTCYTNKTNKAVNYIFHNLRGLSVATEDDKLIELRADDKQAFDVITTLSAVDVAVAFEPGQSIEEVRKILELYAQ